MYIVYCLVDHLPKKKGCIIAHEDELVQSIYVAAFGPDTLEACGNWIEQNQSGINTNDDEVDSDVSYDEDELFYQSDESNYSSTDFEISGETHLVPARQMYNLDAPARSGCSLTLYANGTPGAQVTLRLYFLGNGGHSHGANSQDVAATGTITPRSFTLQGPYPQNFPQNYVCGEARGEVLLRQGVLFPNGEVRVYNGVFTNVHQGLQQMPSGNGVVLVGATGSHGSNHWGTSGLVNGLSALGAAFHGKFGKPIYVNDMSLPWGGLFDINANFRQPHQTHREGRNADVNYSSMSEEQAKYFKSKAIELGFSVDLHGTPLHWHLHI